MGRKFFTVSFDDGTEQDIRLVALMEKYGIRGTINLSSALFGQREEGISRMITETHEDGSLRQVRVCYDHTILPLEQAKELYSRDFIEIAGHGAHHLHQAGLERALLQEEIAGDAARLEEIFGRKVRGHIFPYGEYNEDCLKVMEDAGLVYGRLANSGGPDADFAFHAERGIIRPTCRMTDSFALSLLERFIRTSCEQEDLVFYMWGHSFELDYGTETGCDAFLEALFRTAAEANGIEFVTNGELVDALFRK